ncbi:hypothetical protein [Microlunatus sp. Y2014]|uniref:hypothetical protein n=1 Tax=Microlunatus sp. Y2014 TaxID=3418488 RepID=UPI003DA6DD99
MAAIGATTPELLSAQNTSGNEFDIVIELIFLKYSPPGTDCTVTSIPDSSVNFAKVVSNSFTWSGLPQHISVCGVVPEPWDSPPSPCGCAGGCELLKPEQPVSAPVAVSAAAPAPMPSSVRRRIIVGPPGVSGE